MEVVLILIAIGFQILLGIRTFFDIKKLGKVLDVDSFQLQSKTIESIDAKYFEIESSVNFSQETVDLIGGVNKYLMNNKDRAIDFHIIKDIVERNVEQQNNRIVQSISAPLYIGLLGTFIGIIFGLYSLSNVAEFDTELPNLLKGISIAMIASFCGLFIMLVNSVVFHKRAMYRVEENSNNFLSFVQAELLPRFSGGLSSVLEKFEEGIGSFNRRFSANLGQFKKVMEHNLEAYRLQIEFLDKLKEVDIFNSVKANITVLQELQSSVHEFSKFNNYLELLNVFIDRSADYTTKIDTLLNSAEGYEVLANKIIETYDGNTQLQKFIIDHIAAIEQNQQISKEAVTGVTNVLGESLDNLKGYTTNKITEVKRFMNQELEVMNDEYKNRWKNLEHLDKMEDLVRHSKQGGEQQKEMTSAVQKMLSELQKSQKEIVQGLLRIEEKPVQVQIVSISRLKSRFKKWFSSKETNETDKL